MKKLFTLLCFLYVLMPIFSKGQTVVINTGTAGTPAYNAGPIYRSSAGSGYDASRYSYLYTQTELAAAGILPNSSITSLGWIKNNSATTTGGGIFRIFMKNSSATSFSNATETWANLNSSATMVYENLNQDIPATAAPDYITFTFTTPYLYTGGSLEISTEWDINQVTGSPTTGTFDWLWSTVVDRVYGTGNTTLAPITSLSSTTNSISAIDDRRPFLQITYVPSGPCTNPPIPGVVTSTQNPVCLSTDFTLNLTGGTTGTGQTYQWQSSPDSTNWTDISGATSSFLVRNHMASTYYRAVVTCGGSSVNSAGLLVVSPAAVSGAYTINSAQVTGGTNFQTFADAINFIKCGISGPVIFNVAVNSGPYNEQVVFPHINSASATNTITINGNGNTVSFASSNTDARAVIKFDGGDYVTIKDLLIDATGGGTPGTYGWGIHMTNQSNNDSVVNCTVTTDITATTLNYCGIVISGTNTSPTSVGNNANNTVIMGNTITGGYYSISNYGNSVVPFTDNNQFINNNVTEFYLYGIYTLGSTNTVISGNNIQRPTRAVVGAGYGIYVTTNTSGALVEKNRIKNLFDAINTATTAAYGIYISGDGSPASPNKIINNIVSDINHEGTIYGIYNSGAANMLAYHNTISLDNASATAGATYGFYQVTSDTGIMFQNNIISITRGGTGNKFGIYMSTPTTPLISNYNNIYLNSAGSGTQAFGFNNSNRATLSDWQTATGFDLNSLSIDPVYTALGSDYIPTANPLNNRGTPVGVLTDIVGAVRSSTNPDLGAYEFTVAGCTSPPIAGDAVSISPSVCFNFPLALQLSNNSTGLGQTYQWESATSAAGPWSAVGGVISNPDTTFPATATMYYRAAVTCGASTAYSTPVLITVNPPVSGVYTINSGAATGGTNFQNFADAINSIKCGVSGPVTFNVTPGSGPYNEQIVIPIIAGTSGTNTVTFNGNGNTVNFASADANAKAVIKLDGSDFVTINNFVIEAIGGTYGWGILLSNQANNDSIVNCTITVDGTQTTTFFAGIVISAASSSPTLAGNNANNTVIMGNTINNGYYSIVNYGNSIAPFTDNNKIINNTLNDFYFYGIYNYGSINAIIKNNTIQRLTRTTVGTGYGIYITTYSQGAEVENNKIQHLFGGATTSTSTAAGIYVSSDGIASKPTRIVNNIISDMNHEGPIYGLYFSGASQMLAYHNTVSLDNTTATAGTTYGIYQVTVDTGVVVINNIITVTRGGSGTKYGYYMGTSAIPVVSNYNDIYVNSLGTGTQGFGYQNGGTKATLADWQTASGLDMNSLSIDPVYTALGTDYKPTAVSLNNRGTPVGVLLDITGAVRSTTTPDMGAIEFTVAGCTSPPTPGDATSPSSSVCFNAPLTLQLTNNSAGIGQTYQWESSTTSSGPWSPVGGAISNPDTTFPSTATLYYRAAVTCGVATTYSTPFLINVNQPISGAFTINSANPTGGTNFQTFADAINSVKCGVNGPVTFNVAAGSGPYNEQLVIPAIAGTSAANTVVFNGNGATVNFASADVNAKAVFKLSGADYVTIKNFIIDATGGTNGWGIHLTNQANNDSIVNCTITTDATSTSTSFCGIVISASNTSPTSLGNNANNVVIQGNIVNGGYYGITNYGTNIDPFISNNKFINNAINDFYYSAVYNYGSTGTIISGNTIQRPTRSTVGITYGIYLGANNSGALIEKNRVQRLFDAATTSTSAVYGIYVNGDGTLVNANLIVNNVISDITHEGTIYGIYNAGGAYMRAYHNTISLDYAASTAGTTYGFYQVTADTGIIFKNNLVTISRGGSGTKYGIYMSTSTTPLISNYNDIYLNSAGSGTQAYGYFNGTANATLSDWQTASGFDLNSLSVDPVYTAPGSGDYKPTATALDNYGTPVGILTDIMDSLRSTTVPDMGAYEFSTVMPVRLVDLSAVRIGKDALISWTTSGEINFSHFEVERSANGVSFEKTGTVRAGINSGNLKSYRFNDVGVLNQSAKIYYRLKMVNKDGSAEYSKTVIVKLIKDAEIVTVYPNPIVSELFVRVNLGKAETVTLKLSDRVGRLINKTSQTLSTGTSLISLPVSDMLAQGIYIVTVEINGEKFNYKVVK